MFFGDHNPPHFHAYYAESRARLALDGTILDGTLPRRAQRLIRAWVRLHPAEFAASWERARHHASPGTIEPLP